MASRFSKQVTKRLSYVPILESSLTPHINKVYRQSCIVEEWPLRGGSSAI